MSSAADMLKRFREAEPTSRAERESARAAGDVQEMWWKGNRSSAVDSQEYSRGMAPLVARNSHDFEEDVDTMGSRPPARSTNPYAQLTSIDDLITREIQNLEREIVNDPVRTIGGIDVNIRQSSEGPVMGLGSGVGMSLTDSKEFLRHSYSQGKSGADPLADLRLSGDYFKSSVDTLGSTGFRALLYPDMKLDGGTVEVEDEKSLAAFADGATANDVLAKAKSMLAELNREDPEIGFDGVPMSSLHSIAANLEADMRGLLVSHEKYTQHNPFCCTPQLSLPFSPFSSLSNSNLSRVMPLF